MGQTFQGIWETDTHRIEWRSDGVYSIYERRGNAFVHAGTAQGDTAEEAFSDFIMAAVEDMEEMR